MDTVSRDVTSLSPSERHVFEGVLGQPLQDHQRVVVGLEAKDHSKSNADRPSRPDQTESNERKGDLERLPDWCAIFSDLSDEEFAGIEAAILTRADLGRNFELDE